MPAIIQLCIKANFLLHAVLFKSPDSAVTVELNKVSPPLIVFEYHQSFRSVLCLYCIAHWIQNAGFPYLSIYLLCFPHYSNDNLLLYPYCGFFNEI